MQRLEANQSPGYLVRKRLGNNKTAIFGLGVILGAFLIAILGYLIMPDNTPDANDGAVQLAKKPPGFSITLIKQRKNIPVEDRSIFRIALEGQPAKHILIPIADYHIDGYQVTVNPYRQENQSETYHLLNLVKPLYIGETLPLKQGNYEIDGDLVTYLDLDGNYRHTTRQELLAEFEENHVEQRTFLLGTDKVGRDLLSRLIYGTRVSLAIGFVAVFISMGLGISLGALSGFFGGKIDDIILWFMSVVWSIPGIMLVIAISMSLQSRGVWVAFVAVGLTMWVEVARVIRGQMIGIKQKAFVEAARAFGISNFRIVFKHIMPNILGPLIVIATSNFAAAILLEAGLSFLGLSVQPPTPSWGIMINDGYYSIGTNNSWHLVFFPGMAICLMVLSFNLLGNGLRDAFDPQTAA